ncbi:MAG: DNA cytosine methyltransferase [Bifidobacteriaceae bacterium]|nr:DNA cytosine methyltransferase [Bifidobacteriaceae bacterium]
MVVTHCQDNRFGRSGSARRPVAVDLFAGAGGLSLGLEQSGFDLLASVEYDPVHATTHAFNFPLTEVLCDDMSGVTSAQVHDAARSGWLAHHSDEPWDGEIDLIAGGPPCQGFSFIGKRDVGDVRNDLIFHFFRVVTALRPRYFIMENVPGIASGKHRGLLDDLMGRFRSAGYALAEPKVLNAADYGVPQDRRRFILMGSLAGVPPLTYPCPQVRPVRRVRSAFGSGDGLPPGPSVWDAIGDLPDLDGFAELLRSDEVPLTPAQLARTTLAASVYAAARRGDPGTEDLAWPRVWDPRLLTSSARTVHTEQSVGRFSATPQGTVERVSRFLRLDEGGLCNTLRAGTGGERGAFTSPRPIHPRLPRVISVREAARLHSFPDWFRFHATKWNGFRQIGNAVPPLLGRALGERVVTALGLAPLRPQEALALGDPALLRLTMTEATAQVGARHESVPLSRRRSQDRRMAGLW